MLANNCDPIQSSSRNMHVQTYMFLTCLILGQFNPKVGIDVFLKPLMDALKKLWTGVLTYDISKKQNFIMRAMLMWTINDFPAYGLLSG